MAQLNFDASQVAPNTGNPDPVPADWYSAMIDQSEMKPTKDGTGTFLELRFNIVEGQYANRKIYARLNLRNANPVAQEIAYGELSAICHATSVMQLQDSQQLHGQPMKIKVAVRPAKDGYEANNDIKSYENANATTGGGSAPAAGGMPAGFGTQPAQQPAQQPTQQPAQQTQQQPAQQPWQQPAQTQPAQPQHDTAQQAQPWQQPAQQPAQPQQQPAQAGNGMPPWAAGQPQG